MEEVDEEMGVAQPDTPDNSAFKSESARALLSTFLHLFSPFFWTFSETREDEKGST